MPGTSAATQSRLWGWSPYDPSEVSASMRDTSAFSANTWKGRRILRFMGARWLGFRGVIRLFRLADGPDHVERPLGVVLVLVAEDALTPVEGVLEADELPLDPAELLGGEERLRQEPVQPPRAGDRLSVLGGELLQAEHGDDVLQVLVLRQRAADLLRQVVVALADDARRR